MHARRLRTAIAVLFITLTAFTSAELFARRLVVDAPRPWLPAEQAGEWLAFRQTDTSDGGSFHSAHYNVDYGTRRVVGIPEYAPHTVWLFGSSPAFDMLVNDADTFASQLQAHLANRYRVVNLAAIGDSVAVSLARLRKIRLSAGDVVIFYHGTIAAESIWNALVYQRKQTYSACMWLHDNFYTLGLVRTGCDWVIWSRPAGLDKAIQDRLPAVVRDYASGITEAKATAEQHGARFFAVLEPALYSREILPHEAWIIESDTIAMPGLEQVYAALWPRLRAIPEIVDFTHLLDDAREEKLLYGDSTHLNAAGDRLVAAALWDLIDARTKG